MVLVSHRQLKTFLIREQLGLLLGHINPYVMDGLHEAAILDDDVGDKAYASLITLSPKFSSSLEL